MQRHLSFLVAAVFVFVFAPGTVQGQDDAIREAIEKAVEQAKKAITQEVEKIVQASEKRIVELEKALEQKERRIAELEAKVRELSEGKKPPKPPARPAFLGVGHVDPPGDVLEKLGVKKGALVTQVVPKSPAAAAGLQPGDVILAVGGDEVASADLGARVGKMKPGQKVDITVLRAGKKMTKTATLVDREKFLAERPIPVPQPPVEPKKEPVVLGVRIEERDEGIIVTDVEGGFTGSVAGLKSGDKLLELNGKKLGVIEDVVGALKGVVEGDELTLGYQRGEQKMVAKVLGAHGNKGAKLVEIKKSGEKPVPEKPETPKKRALLGIAAVPADSGVQVASVVPETAAAAAGLQAGDIIKELNGKPVPDVNQLKELLSMCAPGDKITLQFQRGDKVITAEVVLAAEGEKVAVPEKVQPPKPEPPKPETPKAPGRLGIKASQSTDNVVRVKTVDAGGPAAKAGLEPGDVLLKANGKDVRSLDDLAGALQGLFAGDTLSLLVKRGEEEKELSVTLGKR